MRGPFQVILRASCLAAALLGTTLAGVKEKDGCRLLEPNLGALGLTLFDAASDRFLPLTEANLNKLNSSEDGISIDRYLACAAKAEDLIIRVYPCAAGEGASINLKAAEIFRQLERAGSPIAELSTGNWVVYQEAARVLGIAPEVSLGPRGP